MLIGPDQESEQWVRGVAEAVQAPYVILEKIRRGDRDVEISIPNMEAYTGYTPVLVDDIIATARTLMAIVGRLRQTGMKAPICIGVHAVFTGNAYQELRASGVQSVVTCNTIEHVSNAIDMHERVAKETQDLARHYPGSF